MVIKQNSNTLVCFFGTLRCLDITSKNLIDKLIKPLNADVMICVSKMNEHDEDGLRYFQDCNLVDVCIYEDSNFGYEFLCTEYAKKLNQKDTSQWREYLAIKGNWLGGMKGRKGSGMHLTYNYWKVLERLNSLKAQNINYERIVVTRTDLFWLIEHPPLELLNSKIVWIPTGQDYEGYNDRHAVCSKDNINNYLNLFEQMMNFTAKNYLASKRWLNHELYLYLHLHYNNIVVGRFKNVAYLTAIKATKTRWAKPKTKFIKGEEYNYKYEQELLEAIKNSEQWYKEHSWHNMISKFPFLKYKTQNLKDKIYQLGKRIYNQAAPNRFKIN